MMIDRNGVIFLVAILIGIQFFSLVVAEEFSDDYSVDTRIKQFNDELTAYSSGTSSLSLNEIFNIALERKNLMESLTKTNPDDFLRLVLSEEFRNNLPSDVKALVEKPIRDYEGPIDVISIDREDSEEIAYAINDINDKLVRLYFKNGLEKPVDSRNIVKFSGFMIGKIIVVDNIEFLYSSMMEGTVEESQEGGGGEEVEEASVSCNYPFTRGLQKVAYVLFSYRDEVVDSTIRSRNVQYLSDVNLFYRDQSNRRMGIDFDVYRHFINKDFPGDALDVLMDLRNEDRAGRLNIPPLYSYVVGLTSGNLEASTVGIGFVGPPKAGERYQAIVEDLSGSDITGSLLGHELGHNFGLIHTADNDKRCNIMYPSLGSGSRCPEITSNPLQSFLNDGQKQELGWIGPGSENCANSIPPGVIVLRISSPLREQVLSGNSVDIRGIARGLVFENCRGRSEPNYPCDRYVLTYRQGLTTQNVLGFIPIVQGIADKETIESLGTWNIDSLSNGWYTIRLRVTYRDEGVTRSVATFKHVKIDRSGVTQRAIIEGFVRGDANGDEIIDITDGIEILAYLFKGGEVPSCQDGADADDDGKVTLTDAVKILNHLFQGGLELPAPYPELGLDNTPDELGCN